MKLIIGAGTVVAIMTFGHCIYYRICGCCTKRQYKRAKFGIAFLVSGMLAAWFGIDCPFNAFFSSWKELCIWFTLCCMYVAIGFWFIIRYYLYAIKKANQTGNGE